MDEGTHSELIGAAELARTLERAQRDLADTRDVDRAAAEIAVSASRGRAPVRTGRLRASGRADVSAGAGRIVFEVPYALFVHWGVPSRGIEPNPFAMQGARETEPLWTRLYERHLDKSIDGIRGA